MNTSSKCRDIDPVFYLKFKSQLFSLNQEKIVCTSGVSPKDSDLRYKFYCLCMIMVESSHVVFEIRWFIVLFYCTSGRELFYCTIKCHKIRYLSIKNKHVWVWISNSSHHFSRWISSFKRFCPTVPVVFF